MPFLTQIGSAGGAPSYYPALSETTGMFIIANYGSAQVRAAPVYFFSLTRACSLSERSHSLPLTHSSLSSSPPPLPFSAQGYDNDDGSNHDHTRRNFFYQADGFKMDYGGSDSIFESNVVIVRPCELLCAACSPLLSFLPH